jgi:hypothetical protein
MFLVNSNFYSFSQHQAKRTRGAAYSKSKPKVLTTHECSREKQANVELSGEVDTVTSLHLSQDFFGSFLISLRPALICKHWKELVMKAFFLISRMATHLFVHCST